jgi:3-oxoacyl-(acyl-carrier-protein) synthase
MAGNYKNCNWMFVSEKNSQIFSIQSWSNPASSSIKSQPSRRLFLHDSVSKGKQYCRKVNLQGFSLSPELRNMNREVYIAGLGVVTAIGNNVAECLSALQREKDGIGDITFLQTRHKGIVPVAEVKLSNQELAKLAGTSPDTSRSVLLSLTAVREALKDAAIGDLSSFRTGFVSSNTSGRMDKTDDFFKEFIIDSSKGKLRHIFDHECGGVTQAVADQLGIKDYVTTINTACSSSANAILFGARLIKNDLMDIVIAGGTDALTRFTLNGFISLMLIDKNPCRPFDENRAGLTMGEGAGYIVMVSERVKSKIDNSSYARLSGYHNSNDAFHQTASSADGTGSYLAMKNALVKGGLAKTDIDYINLHGTGTDNNDSTEGAAIKRLFDPYYPPVSSTKSFTGHALGASGGIEAVFSILAIRHGVIFPNLRFRTKMAELPFTPERRFLKNQSVNHVMSNSFGFGGNCTSLIFSRV